MSINLRANLSVAPQARSVVALPSTVINAVVWLRRTAERERDYRRSLSELRAADRALLDEVGICRAEIEFSLRPILRS